MSDDKRTQTTFLIVGGGIAGVSCAETVSYLCPEDTITLLTETSLIKAVSNLVPLGKVIAKFDVEERNAKNGMNNKVQVIVDSLEAINSTTREVHTLSGLTIEFKYLCLCTGGRPKLIEAGNPFIIGIRDTESVLEFQEKIKTSRKLVLVGNGGIASEIAYEVKNIEIDWVVKDNYISSTFVDPGAAEFFQSRLANKEQPTTEKNVVKRMRYAEEHATSSSKRGAALGPDWHRQIDVSGNERNLSSSVNIHFQSEVKSIETCADSTNPDDFHLKVTLTNNKIIACDFVVSATGVVPRISYKVDKEFQLGDDSGINVNEMMETNLPGIYAAGDVCHAGWPSAEHWFQMRLWTQARQMGCMAGRSMAAALAGEQIYQDFCFELFGHVTNLFGYQVVLLGRYNGQGLGTDYEVLLRFTPEKEYIKFVLKDGRLKGAILIGETGLEETCENLILNQLDLTPYGDDILNPDIDIEDYFD